MRGAKQERMNFEYLIMELSRAHGLKALLSIIISWIGVNLMPVASFIAVGIVLVTCDWITGVTAARMQKVKITSRGLFRSVQKIVFYSLAIVLVLIVEKSMLGTDWLVYLVSSYIAMVELYSNLENISVITGTNIIGVVKNAIGEYLKNKIPKA